VQVWAIVDGALRKLRVTVQRRFYVNSRVNDAVDMARAVQVCVIVEIVFN